VSCPNGTKCYAELSRLGRQRFLKAVSPWLPLADEWVRLPVDVLVTDGTGVLATRQATDTIPIVSAEPLAEGLVGSPEAGWLVITPVPNTDA
jgi:hypothetical protein